jgi:hypothetical protein
MISVSCSTAVVLFQGQLALAFFVAQQSFSVVVVLLHYPSIPYSFALSIPSKSLCCCLLFPRQLVDVLEPDVYKDVLETDVYKAARLGIL